MMRVTIARIVGLVARRQRPDRRLDAVGEHQDGRLARLRLGAGVAEPARRRPRRPPSPLGRREPAVRRRRLLPRLGVEVAHQCRAVVLRDERDQGLGQPRPVGDVDAVGDVRLEDLGRHLRRQLVVDVLAAGLVLDERQRVVELADVVVVGGDAGEERVGADRFRGTLGEIADHQRVVVGPGRLGQEPPQERLRRVGQLEQLEHGQDAEEVAEHGERCRRRRPQRRRRRERRAPQLEHAHVDVAFARAARTSRRRAMLTTATARPAWTNTCSRSPRRTAMIPARPPSAT